MIIRNVILDWSGTLVDDLTPVLKTTNYVLESCGLPALSREEFRAQFCLPIRKFYERRVPHVPQARLEQIFLAEYPKHHAEITLLPHTLEFLRFCQQRHMGVYIASTVDAHTYETQMIRFGIGGFITKPYIGIQDKTSKIHHILEENSLGRDETMFVGDMEHDVRSGPGRRHPHLRGANGVQSSRQTARDEPGPDLPPSRRTARVHCRTRGRAWIRSSSKISKWTRALV